MCLEDHNKICVSCALFGGHKHHNVKNIDVKNSLKIILGSDN